MQKATKPQIAKLHVLLNNLGLIDQKADIVAQVSGGRTESSRELTVDEARVLIGNLAQDDPADRLRGLIFSLAYRAGIIYGDTPEDKKINAAKLNMFLKAKGAVKLELNQMRYKELITVHRQFEAIVKNVAKAHDSRKADTAVKELLNQFDNVHTL
jgi:hypothetical protein